MVSSFHLTRSARLVLAHPIHADKTKSFSYLRESAFIGGQHQRRGGTGVWLRL